MNESPLKEMLYASLNYISISKVDEFRNNSEKATIVWTFAKLWYSDLVHRVLEWSLWDKTTYRMKSFLHSALMWYVESGNIEKALHLYKKYGENIDRNDSDFLMIIASNPLYDTYLLQFIPLISPNSQLNESLWNVFWLLWKSWRHETMGEIQQILAEPLQKFVDLISWLYRNVYPSGEKVWVILLWIFENIEQNMWWGMFDKIIDTLHNLGYPLPEIGKTLQFLKWALQRTFVWSTDLVRKLIGYYNERGLFDKAYEFSGGNYDETILWAKYKYALKTKDGVLHNACLKEYLQKTDSWLENENASGYSWRIPYEIASIKAERYGEIAIYELLYGSEEKWREYISLMIESVESIMWQIPNHAKKEHKLHIRWKIKNTLKRSLKEAFVLAWVFHYLPKIYGWNTPILDSEVRKANSIVQRKHREVAWEERKKEEELNVLSRKQARMQPIQELLSRNDKDWVKKCLQIDENIYRHTPLEGLWDVGIMIIEKYPDLYYETLKALGGYDKEYSDFIPFFIRGMELGCISREDWEIFIKPYQWGNWHIDHRIHKVILPLIQWLLNIWRVSDAWEFYLSLQSKINNASEILKTFLLKWGNPNNPDPDNMAFAGIDSEQLERETVAYRQSYWHTRADVASILSDDVMYQEAVSKERDNLISRTDVPIASRTRGYVRTVVNNPLRSAHQIKDEIIWILSSPLGKDEKVRRRAVYHLMEKAIPWAEALWDIKKRSNPDRIQRFFFQKLIEKKYITENTKYFLIRDWKEQIIFLRRLLAQHQNDFNTVIDILFKKNAWDMTSYGMSRLSELGVSITPSKWEWVFTTLRIVWVITPGIWEQAISVNFDEKKLRELSEKIKYTKKLLFRNEPMPDDIHPSLQAEIIYQAYRPVNMSYQRVVSMLGKVPDCSHHLNKYVIPEEWYAMSIQSQQELVLRRNVTADESIFTFFIKIIRHQIITENQAVARILTDIGRLKVDGINQENLLLLFEALFGEYISEHLLTKYDGYKTLRDYSDFLGIYIQDNLEDRIREFFESHQESTSKIFSSFLESLKTEKRKKALETQLGITIPEEIDIRFASHLIAKIFLEKIKVLSDMRRTLSKEIKKYVNQDGSEVSEKDIKLKAYISKNTASFFAKASAWLCTSEDIELFKRADHFHINIVDAKRQECVWNVMGYTIQYKGKKVLLLRWFNPNTALLKDIDVASFCESILEIAKEFAIANGFNSVYITENAWYMHTLSNRGEIVQYLTKKYGTRWEVFSYSVSSEYTIQRIFLIFENQLTRQQVDEENFWF